MENNTPTVPRERFRKSKKQINLEIMRQCFDFDCPEDKKHFVDIYYQTSKTVPVQIGEIIRKYLYETRNRSQTN